jgi:hypothetical protein
MNSTFKQLVEGEAKAMQEFVAQSMNVFTKFNVCRPPSLNSCYINSRLTDVRQSEMTLDIWVMLAGIRENSAKVRHTRPSSALLSYMHIRRSLLMVGKF